MNKVIISTLIITLLSLFSINTVSAQNYPCSGKKGGVSHCENGKFICNMEAQVNQNEFVLMKVIQRKNRPFQI
ncbi:hypothetical protein MOV59_000439 [Proteus mirabilis]|uniref:hypothetical protein n=1 Tax=Proteus TaxID=583 RepID=UPI000D86E3BC|nr:MULTISPECIES: hypothetical protein [Proteus]MCS4547539.1 hypothetical protein [Proteus mirabilis]MCU9604269.1 hypothetical protein [Proteus mirabilis]MDF7366013.1 hypothetical protein [Proteus mirabilis]SPY39139.1 Uncharacterised protein [Proteus mirabilis]GLX62985.1 hypothetical protein KMU_10260 [Proteus vulgaris]